MNKDEVRARTATATGTWTQPESQSNVIEDEPPDLEENPRLVMTSYDDAGNIVQRSYGPSQQELLDAHNNGTCDLWCNYCYEEACATLNESIL